MAIVLNIDGVTDSANIRSGRQVQRISRDYGMITGTITFDSSYADGGELIAGTTVLDSDGNVTGLDQLFNTFGSSLSSILEFDVNLPNGYSYKLDTSTKGSEKLRVYDAGVPPIVFEENIDADADTDIPIKYPAAHINYIATVAAPKIPVFGGITPTAGMVAVNMGCLSTSTTGTITKGAQTKLTFVGGEGTTTTKVSYITQAWKDVSDNMGVLKVEGNGTGVDQIFGETTAATWASDVLTLGTDVVGVSSHTWDNGGTIVIPSVVLGVGVAPAATEIAIDYLNSNTALVTYQATDQTETDGDFIYMQYIKQPATGFLVDRFENALITESTNTFTFLSNPLLYGSCGQWPSGVTLNGLDIVTIQDTVATGQAHFTTIAQSPNGMTGPVHVTEEAAGDEDMVPAYLYGSIGEIETQAIEVPAADYSGWGALRFKAIGRIRP